MSTSSNYQNDPGSCASLKTPDQSMRHALALGRRAMGATGDNPAVGCVICAATGEIVGLGWTGEGGQPHAEIRALAMAGPAARGGTAYVTLEPCSHWARTPPCTHALIAAGLKRCFVALADPDMRVAGQGIAQLRAAGIEVVVDIGGAQARRDLAGYLSRKTRKRPHVMLKLAVSQDGRIAARPGFPTAVTGAQAKDAVHMMRARCDGLLVGVGTVISDDPALTCRLPGLFHLSPVRLVCDSRLRIPLKAEVVVTARQTPTWILTTAPPSAPKAGVLRNAGVMLVHCAAAAGGLVDLHDALFKLGGYGLNRIMVEGGARLARAFVADGLTDEAVIIEAPRLFGAEGLDALAGLPLSVITASPAFAVSGRRRLGCDQLTQYEYRQGDKVMFSGIITDVGEIISLTDDGTRRCEIACSYDLPATAVGSSICCAGVCLTVTSSRRLPDDRSVFSVDISHETLSRTTLGDWRVGQKVNLERSLRLGDELGGHIVSGHVDGVGHVKSVEPKGEALHVTFRLEEDLCRFLAPKGSVAIDGTSFTVNLAGRDTFDIMIIPHSRAVTTWRDVSVGQAVNIEVDVLARYVARLARADTSD